MLPLMSIEDSNFWVPAQRDSLRKKRRQYQRNLPVHHSLGCPCLVISCDFELSLAPLPSLFLSFMITGMELGAVMRTTGVHVGVMKQFGWWCCCCSCLRTLENTKEVNSGRGFQDLHVPMLVAFLVYSLSRPTFRCSGLWRPSDG